MTTFTVVEALRLASDLYDETLLSRVIKGDALNGFKRLMWVAMLASLALATIGMVSSAAAAGWPGLRFMPLDPKWAPATHLTAVQPDGKVIAIGNLDEDPMYPDRMTVTRLLPSGELDRTFGESGRSVIETRGLWVFFDVEIQPGGGIIVLGGGNDTVGTVRVTPEGELDRDFGKDGMATISGLLDWGIPWGEITLGDEGKITYAGTLYFKYPKPFWNTMSGIVWRLNADGSRDRSLDGTGLVKRTGAWSRVVISGRSEADGSVISIGARRLTRRLIGGFARFGVSLMKLDPSGTPDQGFGKHGIKPLKGLYGAAPAGWRFRTCSPAFSRFDERGRIVLLATCEAARRNRIRNFGVLLRYLPSGALDRSFNSRGSKVLPGKPDSIYASFAFGPEGTITIAGGRFFADAAFLTRVEEDGRLSRDFGTRGVKQFGDRRTSFQPSIAVDSRGWTFAPLNFFKPGKGRAADRGWAGVIGIDRNGGVG